MTAGKVCTLIELQCKIGDAEEAALAAPAGSEEEARLLAQVRRLRDEEFRVRKSAKPPLRMALVTGGLGADLNTVRAYLPSNYHAYEHDGAVRIVGRDNHGWTLDGYVIPRLGSGLIAVKEIRGEEPPLVIICEGTYEPAEEGTRCSSCGDEAGPDELGRPCGRDLAEEVLG